MTTIKRILEAAKVGAVLTVICAGAAGILHLFMKWVFLLPAGEFIALLFLGLFVLATAIAYEGKK